MKKAPYSFLLIVFVLMHETSRDEKHHFSIFGPKMKKKKACWRLICLCAVFPLFARSFIFSFHNVFFPVISNELTEKPNKHYFQLCARVLCEYVLQLNWFVFSTYFFYSCALYSSVINASHSTDFTSGCFFLMFILKYIHQKHHFLPLESCLRENGEWETIASFLRAV